MAGTVKELKFLVPWGHIAAKAWGCPKDRPVLCLHGWLDNANTFNRLIPLLPRDCYYLAIDLGGHGLSSHRPAGFPYHFMDYVGDVRRVTSALKWNQFTIMGHSMGGSVAGMFSCVFPELVDRLILVESYGFYPRPKVYRGPESHKQQKASSQLIPRDALSNVEEWEKVLHSTRTVIEYLLKTEANPLLSPKVRTPDAALQRLLEANTHLTEESGRILLERGATEVSGGMVFRRDLRLLMHTYGSTSVDQHVNYLKRIQADVLMIIAQDGIFNKDTPEIPTDFTEQIQQGFKTFLKEHFHFINVSGNHFVHLNEPEIVAGIISNFINKGQHHKASL